MNSLLQGNKYSNEYDLSGGSDNTWTLTMKPIFESDLDKRTVDQAIETIRDRVDSLGVSEPLIQEYGLGENQILVELPGISDLDQVKNIIKSTARLEIHAVEGGPVPEREQAALASVGGALPPERGDSAQFRRSGAVRARPPTTFWSAPRSWRAATSAPPSPASNSNTGQRTVNFTLTDEAGDKFWDYTSANVGKTWPW